MVLLNNTCYNITFEHEDGIKINFTKLNHPTSPGYLKYNNTNWIIENSDSLTISTSTYEYTSIKKPSSLSYGLLKYDYNVDSWIISKDEDNKNDIIDLYDKNKILLEIEYSIDNTDWFEIYQGVFIDLTYNTGESAILYLRIKRCSLTTVYKKHYRFI